MDRIISSRYSQSQNYISGAACVSLPTSSANNLQQGNLEIAAKVEMVGMRISAVNF